MKTVSSEIIDTITHRLIKEFSPEKIILFGSYVKGNPDDDSDIDLLIVKDTNERFIDRWITVRRILSDPKRKVAIDTFVLTPQEVADRLARGDQFVADIIGNGKVLYAA